MPRPARPRPRFRPSQSLLGRPAVIAHPVCRAQCHCACACRVPVPERAVSRRRALTGGQPSGGQGSSAVGMQSAKINCTSVTSHITSFAAGSPPSQRASPSLSLRCPRSRPACPGLACLPACLHCAKLGWAPRHHGLSSADARVPAAAAGDRLPPNHGLVPATIAQRRPSSIVQRPSSLVPVSSVERRACQSPAPPAATRMHRIVLYSTQTRRRRQRAGTATATPSRESQWAILVTNVGGCSCSTRSQPASLHGSARAAAAAAIPAHRSLVRHASTQHAPSKLPPPPPPPSWPVSGLDSKRHRPAMSTELGGIRPDHAAPCACGRATSRPCPTPTTMHLQ